MKNIHIIGISGKGTSSLAIILQQKGYRVTGSDSGIFEPIHTSLLTNNIHYTVGYSKNNIPKDVDAFIVGSSAQLSVETNEEVREAKATGLPLFSFAEFLETLTKDTFNIVIAGSYGKSTCTSLIAFIVQKSGKNPSYFIGAEPIDLPSARSGADPLFILEGDEYPHDTISTTPKFLFYNPHTVLLTSGAHDHINKFPTLESYLETYRSLLTKVSGGIVVAGIEHPHISLLTENYPNLITYGLHKGNYTAKNIERGTITKFDVYKNQEKLFTTQTQLLGEHSIENILGASAILLENNIVSIKNLEKLIPLFRGVMKRLQLHNPGHMTPVYESFGSSFEKAKADIQAIQEYLPEKKIILVFEPHTFGWRNKENITWYDIIFSNLPCVFIYKPTQAGSQSHEQLTLQEIVERIYQTNQNVFAIEDKNQLLNSIQEKIQEDSLVLLMTSSNFDGALETIISYFQN